jgi:predicted transcriptional regulator
MTPTRDPVFHGDLQAAVMAALWRLGSGTVADVREALTGKPRPGYTSVQTVLNRLMDRGLLERRRAGRAFVYRPRMNEAEYLTRAISRSLSRASAPARAAALVNLVDVLSPAELSELSRISRQVARRRGVG